MRMCFVIFALLILDATASVAQAPLPTGTSSLFSGSGNCVLCHQAAGGEANIWQGQDVSTITDWRATMMANATKDPFWRAIVAVEVHRFPTRKEFVESSCTRCHSPIGFTDAVASGKTGYSIAELEGDPLANDGVSCTVCHQITAEGLGTPASYSGQYTIRKDRLLYGPYDKSDTTLMPAVAGYTSRFASHIMRSELCATCHTLFTPALDSLGNPTGVFPEQTPYLEWKNSIYALKGTQCQDCHMPVLPDSIKISGMGSFGRRAPYSRHEFVGGNVYMLSLIRDYIDSLGITATARHFDSTIARTARSLSLRSLTLQTSAAYRNDSLEVRVVVKNLTGHKLPTGIPFRRMWLHTLVRSATGDTVFESGGWDRVGRLGSRTEPFEPHHRIITTRAQVQIYEAVIGDQHGGLTHSLMRAARYLKDNRIPPAGFTRSHPSYDSTAIVGDALNDPDFNRDGSTEGTGSDVVIYRFPVPAQIACTVTVEACFQSVNPEVVEETRQLPLRDVTRFLQMYDMRPNIPFVMKRVTMDISTAVGQTTILPQAFRLEQNYPNPFNPTTIIRYALPHRSYVRLVVFNSLGQEVARLVDADIDAGNHDVVFDAEKLASGMYFYHITAGGYTQTRMLLLLR